MAIPAAYLTAGAEVARTLGAIIGSGRSSLSKNAEKKLPGLEATLNKGITTGDVLGVNALAMKANMPAINQYAAGFGSRFGRSGYARGSAISQLIRSNLPFITQLMQQRLSTNNANKQLLYSTNAQLAGGK